MNLQSIFILYSREHTQQESEDFIQIQDAVLLSLPLICLLVLSGLLTDLLQLSEMAWGSTIDSYSQTIANLKIGG